MEKQGYKFQIPTTGLVVIFLFFFHCLPVAALEIAVNKSVPIQDYSVADIRAMFTMKKRTWPNGRTIQVYTLSDSHPLHKKFVKNILQLFPHQLRRIWDRMTYSGTGTTPVEVGSEQEMLDKLAKTPDAIGYLDLKSEKDNIHVLKYR